MLEQVGLTVNLVPIEWAQWIDQVFLHSRFRRDHHLPYRAARPRYLRPRQILFQLHSPEYTALYKKLSRGHRSRKGAVCRCSAICSASCLTDEPNIFLFALAQGWRLERQLRGLWENDPVPANDVTEVYWAD